jgi:hypothetical protein
LVRADELAGEAGFVAVHQFERVGFVAQGAESQSGASAFGLGFVDLGLFADFVAHVGAFEFPEAYLTPTAHDHVLHVSELDFVLGLELVVEGFGESGETIGVFALDRDGFGEHAVIEAVAGGSEPAGGRDRPAGFGAVGAGGIVLEFGAHIFRFSIGMGDWGYVVKLFVCSEN